MSIGAWYQLWKNSKFCNRRFIPANHKHYIRFWYEMKIIIYWQLTLCIGNLFYFFFLFLKSLPWLATSKTWTGPWTRTLKNRDPEKPGPWKTWPQKNMDPEKPGHWKTWTLKNLDSEKPGPWKTWTLKSMDYEKPTLWKTRETAGWNKKRLEDHMT